jgi:hypothetical protein
MDDPINDREKEIDFLESQIPMLAEAACRIAYISTLAAGRSVLEASPEGGIYEVFPTGERRLVKKTLPYIPVNMDQTLYIS